MQTVLTGGQLTCDVVVPNMGTFTGSFYFQAASITGEHNKEAVYDLTLESNGSVNLQ
jgi:predicted secreted protein